jgi:hypothetical protein
MELSLSARYYLIWKFMHNYIFHLVRNRDVFDRERVFKNGSYIFNSLSGRVVGYQEMQ